MVQPDERILLIQQVGLFQGVDQTELASIADQMVEISYGDGEVVFLEGDFGDRLYLILSGAMHVYVEREGSIITYGHLQTGECFGEMALLEETPRSATVRSEGASICLTLSKDELLHLINQQPNLALRMIRGLVMRLQDTSVRLQDYARPPMPKIFISYRRDDSAGHAGRLYDRLDGHFGQSQVFMDVDAIRPGLNFVDVVERAVGVCDRLIAVIGREWLWASDTTGVRRLEVPEDLVRLEISTALKRDIQVIPVLVQGAQMPRAVDLPEDLKELALRNALEVSDAHFRTDVDHLIDELESPTFERLADTGTKNL